MKTFTFSVILFVSAFTGQNVLGQATQRVRPDFQHGDIVTSNTGRMDGELGIASEANSDNLVGVYNESTQISNIPNILISGIAYVKFDHSNGEVLRGDFIASSNAQGKGMKTNSAGMIIGVALESSTPSTSLLKILVQPSWTIPANAN